MKSFSRPNSLSLLTGSIIFSSNLSAQTFIWDDKSNGQLLFDCNPLNNTGERFASNNNLWNQSLDISANPCSDNPAIARAVELSNWNTSTPPNSTTADVVLSGSSPVTNLNNDVSVSTLLVDTTNELQIVRFGKLRVHGGMIQNDGRITLVPRPPTGGGYLEASALLEITSNTLLSGNGTLLFSTSSPSYITASSPAHLLTVGAGQTILTSAEARASDTRSRISASLRNLGRITASEGGLQLDTEPKFNTSTVEAINGGTIGLRNVFFDNTGGILLAGAGSSVQLDNATITGGTLGGAGEFTVLLDNDGTLAGPITIAAEATLSVEATRNNLFLTGTVTNNGTLRIAEGNGNGSTGVGIVGNVTLLGSGRVLFDSPDDNRLNSAAPGDLLTIGPAQQIITSGVTQLGRSRLIAAFTNQGTITANIGDLQLDTNPKTNDGLIQSIGGGELSLSGITVGNANGIIRAGAGSDVLLADAIINGGLLDGSGQFSVRSDLGSEVSATLNGPVTIGPESTISITSTRRNLYLSGTITNNGTVRIAEGNGSGANGLGFVGNVNLLGSGQLLFDSPDDNRLISAAPGDVLTIGPAQQVVTSGVTQLGRSRMIAAFTNQGTITANVGDLQLDTNPKTNNGLIQSTGGGEIGFLDTTVGNANGIIRAGAGSIVRLSDATINGGLLDGSGLFNVIGDVPTLTGPLMIGPGTVLSITGTRNYLNLSGTITHNGTVRIAEVDGNGASGMRIAGNVTLLGPGKILFDSANDNRINAVAPGDVLTIGPAMEITTSALTEAVLNLTSGTRITTTLNNLGTVTANAGNLRLDTALNTNNGTFRATGGGVMQLFSADTLHTNYNAASGVLTGGRYEVIGNGSSIVFQNAAITEIAAGTAVVIGGEGASIPALSSLQRVSGMLALRSRATLNVPQNLAVSGRLEFGLEDGSATGFTSTALAVTGALDLTGAIIDIADLGTTDGSYRILTATGPITGTPVLGNIPSNLGVSVLVAGGAVTVNVFTAPKMLDVGRSETTGTVTLSYQSLSGKVFRVRGGTDPTTLGEILPDTAMGNGGTMIYTHTPPTTAGRYYYRLIRGLVAGPSFGA